MEFQQRVIVEKIAKNPKKSTKNRNTYHFDRFDQCYLEINDHSNGFSCCVENGWRQSESTTLNQSDSSYEF